MLREELGVVDSPAYLLQEEGSIESPFLQAFIY
jgi:hypothetical protein